MTVAFDLGYEGKPCNTSLGTTESDNFFYVKFRNPIDCCPTGDYCRTTSNDDRLSTSRSFDACPCLLQHECTTTRAGGVGQASGEEASEWTDPAGTLSGYED
jgi:hypothetical protein